MSNLDDIPGITRHNSLTQMTEKAMNEKEITSHRLELHDIIA